MGTRLMRVSWARTTEAGTTSSHAKLHKVLFAGLLLEANFPWKPYLSTSVHRALFCLSTPPSRAAPVSGIALRVKDTEWGEIRSLCHRCAQADRRANQPVGAEGGCYQNAKEGGERLWAISQCFLGW